MTHCQIYVPEGAGIKMGKDSQKVLMEMQKLRAQSRQEDNNGDNNNK